MAMTPEKKVKQRVVAQLKELGAYYFYPATGGYGSSGLPDVVCCLDGRFIGIECKAGKGKTTALQDKNLREIEPAASPLLLMKTMWTTSRGLFASGSTSWSFLAIREREQLTDLLKS
jgi:Holliday junction resolvase